MARIIKIEPVERVFSLTWMSDVRCNYSCSYCPEELHSSSAELKTMDQLKRNWVSIFDKSSHLDLKYKIAFTGGEVTVNKNFLPFVEWLRSNYQTHLHSIGFTTNGSASANYYLRALNSVEYISFSTHSDFIDCNKFIDTVIKVSNQAKQCNKSVHVNVMDEPWNQVIVDKLISSLTANCVFYSVNSIDNSFYNYKVGNA